MLTYITIYLIDLITEFPSAKMIVGSDGSHSVVRKQVFGNKMDVYESLQYIVDIKYEIYGKGNSKGICFLINKIY